MVEAKILPPPPDPPIGRCWASVTMHVWAEMDDTNAAFRMKWPEDWLKEKYYIRDDSRKWLRYTGYPEQVVERKGMKLTITLKEGSHG